MNINISISDKFYHHGKIKQLITKHMEIKNLPSIKLYRPYLDLHVSIQFQVFSKDQLLLLSYSS